MRKHRRVIGYARVSSVEQAIGSSLQDQQDVIEAHARSRSLKVDRMYVEAASAVREKIEHREQMRALMADVRDGDLVLVDKVDRWSRDPEFTYASIRQILSAGAAFYAVGDAVDPSTSQGDSALSFRILFAREEHKRIKERMVGTRRILRDHGYYVDGLVPWGYKRQDVKGRDRNALVIDSDESAVVRRVFQLCIEGAAIDAIAEAVGSDRDRVATTLHNRVYLGEIRNTRGESIRGKHEPIVDAFMFDAAQSALAGRRHGSRPRSEGVETETWWLRDLACCLLCGEKMGAVYGGEPGKRRYYYACVRRCTSKLVRVERVESLCDELVVARLLELQKELATATELKKVRVSPAAEEVAARRIRLDRKRSRYVEAFTDGALSRDELRAHMARLDAERTKLDALAHVEPPATKAQRRDALKDVAVLRDTWGKSSPMAKRKIVRTLARKASFAHGQEPEFVWRTSEEIARGRS